MKENKEKSTKHLHGFFIALNEWKSKLYFTVCYVSIFFRDKNIKMKVDFKLMLPILKPCLMYQHI